MSDLEQIGRQKESDLRPFTEALNADGAVTRLRKKLRAMQLIQSAGWTTAGEADELVTGLNEDVWATALHLGLVAADEQPAWMWAVPLKLSPADASANVLNCIRLRYAKALELAFSVA